MLTKAFREIPDNSQLILHSDQGWQYQMRGYQKMLKDKGIQQSMSRKGNCYDYSVIENFFGILKSEFFHNQKFSSLEHFSKELSEYIDYYNNRRIKVKLNGLSNCVQSQEEIDKERSGSCQGVLSRTIALRITRSLRIQAIKATFFNLPLRINDR